MVANQQQLDYPSEVCEFCKGWVWHRKEPCKCRTGARLYEIPIDREAGFVAELGERVRACRKLRRWSMDDLAKESGISKTNIWQIETGRTEPGAWTLCALSAALQVSMDWLARGES
jgi:DNA-binding XRE family transcriptional regulator